MAGLVAPSVAIAAEVPQVPINSAANTGVSTEPMKVVKVKATKKTSAKVKKSSAKVKKVAKKSVAKKRVRRALASK